MPKGDADTKAARQARLQRLFTSQPGRSWGTAELSGELGVTVRTVQRDIAELDSNGRLPLAEEGEGPALRYRLMEDGRVDLGTLRLDVREGTALYLAARLLAQQTDEYNMHVMNALDKLVDVMPAHIGAGLRPLLGATAVRQARGTDLTERFSALVLGWAQRRVVAVRYRSAHAPAAYSCRVHPYLFEPSGIGRTIYVIGQVTPPGAVRTLKLERIEHASLTNEEFATPAGFDGAAMLGRAWGVMSGDDEPVTVRLRFSRFVAERVRETIWHSSQAISGQPDGGCIWEATIGDITEIGPWVRGWGSDCEVLAPSALRNDVIGHVRRMARGYGLAEAPNTQNQGDQNRLVTAEDRATLDDIFG